MADPISQYLSTYATPEARQISLHKGKRWKWCVGIPCLGEKTLVPTLESLSKATEENILVIAVVNRRKDALKDYVRANEKLLEELPEEFGAFNENVDILTVNRSCEGKFFGPKEGVGLARKIASDIALAAWVEGSIGSPWFSTTDGDAEVDSDYFHLPPAKTSVVHPFRHAPLNREHYLYEIKLRYYVLGLQSAGSPYGFHTIGSTMTFHLGAYAAVRGFPNKMAGEDFYLLNKLSKLGEPVRGGGKITLTPRPSKRVPFGTGAGTAKLIDRELFLYPPRAFETLGYWLKSFHELPEGEESWKRIFPEHPQEISRWLCATGFEKAKKASRGRKQPSQQVAEMHQWFDALKTFQFIRFLTELYGAMPYGEALETADFVKTRDCEGEELLLALEAQELSCPSASLAYRKTDFENRSSS